MLSNINQFTPTQFTSDLGNIGFFTTENEYGPYYADFIGDIMHPQSRVTIPSQPDDFITWFMNILTAMAPSLAGGGDGGIPLTPEGTAPPYSLNGGNIGSGNRGGALEGVSRPVGNFTFQASSGDRVANVADPAGTRSNVMKLDFNVGKLTTNSTSPRAELKVNQNLREGGNYGFQFGVMRKSNYSSTIFQILDHNGTKPAPRMWVAVKDGKYMLYLREASDANAKVIHYDLGRASVGKWDDIKINFKRDVANGSVNISINGKNVFSKVGISTMYNTHSGAAYPKIGQYRNQGDKTPGTLYISDFRTSGG